MKACPSCSHTQEEGNFCGKCGTALVAEVETQQKETQTAAATENVQPDPVQPSAEVAEPNEQIEKIKNESKLFFSFFMQQLKTPTAHFHAVNSGVKNSAISISLYVLLTALAVYSIIQTIFGYYGPSFIQVVFYFALFSVLVLAINVTAVFVTSKLFSENISFKEVIRKIGGFLALPIVFSVVGLLLALIKSYALSTTLLYVGGILAFGTIPTYVMVKLLAQKTKSIDGFYAFLFYIVFTTVIGFVLIMLFADSAIGDMLNYMSF